MTGLHRARAAGQGSLAPAVAATCVLCATRVSVRTIGFDASARALLRVTERVPWPSALARLSATQIGHLVGAVDRRLPGSPACLATALTCVLLLRIAGLDGTIHLGVRKPNARGLEAHAWVTSGGSPILDDSGQAFAELMRLRVS